MNGVPRGWPTFVRSARQLRWANSGEIPREMDKPKGAARKGWETGLHDGTTVEDVGVTTKESHRWQAIASLPRGGVPNRCGGSGSTPPATSTVRDAYSAISWVLASLQDRWPEADAE